MKKNKITKIIIASAITSLLSACNGFFDKDNTPTPAPLVNFKPEATPRLQWETSVNSGIGNDYLKMIPALSADRIFTADKSGAITATNRSNGATMWRQSTDNSLTAGPAVDNGLVFVGSREGKIVALQQSNGQLAWVSTVPTEVLAPPAAHNGIVVVKTIDGQVTALAESDGHTLWHYQEVEPTLILRGGSAPQIEDNQIITGFANGHLVKLNLENGGVVWQAVAAEPTGTFAIQRMVDIDADPYIFGSHVYVATYQGRISALGLSSASALWTHDISSFTGLTVDNERVYVSDAMSHLWGFRADSGSVAWKQTQLESRNITAPALMDHTLVVGDAEGYVHWLSREDGHFVARTQLGGGGVLAAPVVSNNTVYILTMDGHLAAYTLG